MTDRLPLGMAVGLVLGSAWLAEPAWGQSKPLFREIDIAPYGKITLGQEFSQRDEIAVMVDDSTYVLKPGTFGGASAIVVRTNASGAVVALFFEYDNTLQFEEVLTTSTKNLGEPTGRTTAHWPGDRIEIVYWEDGATRLELKRITMAKGVSLSATMLDLKSLPKP